MSDKMKRQLSEESMKKSSSLDVEVGKELADVKTIFKHRDKSLIGWSLQIADKMKKLYKKLNRENK